MQAEKQLGQWFWLALKFWFTWFWRSLSSPKIDLFLIRLEVTQVLAGLLLWLISKFSINLSIDQLDKLIMTAICWYIQNVYQWDPKISLCYLHISKGGRVPRLGLSLHIPIDNQMHILPNSFSLPLLNVGWQTKVRSRSHSRLAASKLSKETTTIIMLQKWSTQMVSVINLESMCWMSVNSSPPLFKSC